jgi:hypothetical protein
MSAHRLELDYAAVPHRPRWLGRALLVAAFTGAGFLVVRYDGLQQERRALQARSDLLDPARHAARLVVPGHLEKELRDIASVRRQLTVPWSQMILTVESTPARDVALLQLQPEPERRILRLTAEAGSPQAMLDYVRRLGDSKLLADVHLVSHEIERENPLHPLQFVAQATVRDFR